MKAQLKKAISEAADAGGPPAELRDDAEKLIVAELPDQGSVGEGEIIDGGGAPSALVAEIEESLEGSEPHDIGTETVGNASDAGPYPGDLTTDVQEPYDYGSDDE